MKSKYRFLSKNTAVFGAALVSGALAHAQHSGASIVGIAIMTIVGSICLCFSGFLDFLDKD